MTPAPLAAESRALRDARWRLLEAATAVGVAELALTGRAPFGLLTRREQRQAMREAGEALDLVQAEIGRARRALALADDGEGR